MDPTIWETICQLNVMLGKRKITEQQCIHVLTQVVTCNQFGMNLASTKTKDTSNKSSKIHVAAKEQWYGGNYKQ